MHAADARGGRALHAVLAASFFERSLVKLFKKSDENRAWSLIFGVFASTLFTLFVIPVAYGLLYANTPRHGLPQSTMDRED